MESDHRVSNRFDQHSIELANRRSLIRILSFLDGQLPYCTSIHTMVRAALSNDPAFRVYFQRQRPEDFNLILGVREEIISGRNEPVKRVWSLTGWYREDKDFINAIGLLDDIHWHRDGVNICSLNYEPSQELQTFVGANIGLIECDLKYFPIYKFYIPIKKALNTELSMPDEVYVQSLERYHAQTIYDYWTYKSITSVEKIADKIMALPSAGVFLKSNNELVSWMLLIPPFGMGCLYTQENHRRKGYATLVTRYLAKRVAQAGFLPTVYIAFDNEPSRQFFTSMDFQQLQPWHFYKLAHLGKI